MILIFGGTTEGRIAANILEEAGKPFYYSTKGDEQEVFLHNGIHLHGAMDEEEIKAFCTEHDIKLIIDAAHPFAEKLRSEINQASCRAHIQLLRFARIYPEHDDDQITWCEEYEDAIDKIKGEEIYTLLALTGVNSIKKLKPLWKENACCYFRILDRKSSREIARKQDFPEKYLHYYRPGEDERVLMRKLHPNAILIKETGLSGGFCEKVEAAKELGIRIFAICRPPEHYAYNIVNGKLGLRYAVDKYLPGFFPLRCGITTGTCAAAAAVAAVCDLFDLNYGLRPYEFPVRLPNGETIIVPVEKQNEVPHSYMMENGIGMVEISASVIKDGGDDPDITDGMRIIANVAVPFNTGDYLPDDLPPNEDYEIIIRGGEGIGIVTLPGLGLEMGESAINPIPRRMIEDNIRYILKQNKISTRNSPIIATISVPGGEEIAKRTFNPRLGIEDGISIVGTTGIVMPSSLDAFINSIRKSMEVARAINSPRIVICSGARSETCLKDYYPDLPTQAFIHCGNFFGKALEIADELDLPQVSVGMMIGKAVKFADGNMNTHSSKAEMNKCFVQHVAMMAGCKQEILNRISQIRLARELWNVIPALHLTNFAQELAKICKWRCATVYPFDNLTMLLITENGDIYE